MGTMGLMIELVRILRVVAEICSERELKKCGIKFGELEKFIFDVLWQKERIATHSTAWDLMKDVEKLADLGVIRLKSGEIMIEDPSEFIKKTAPFELVTRNMTAGNSYLKYIIQRIEDSAREYTALQPS
jgi:hypothetical protein